MTLDATKPADAPRTALVTGAARGIGRAIAVRLLQAGHRVAIVDRDEAALAEIATMLPPERVMTLCSDIAEANAPAALDAAIRFRWEPVSILVNNAAVSPKHNGKAAGLEQISIEEWQRVMDVNLSAPMRLAARFAAFMRTQRWGRIINMSSRAGRSVAPSAGPAYTTSKTALLGLTRSIASEYATYGVTCNAVAPGLVMTQLTRAVTPELLETIRSRTPLGRGGEPEEIAAVVSFLASEDAGFITGACIDVNGGTFTC